MLMRKSRKTFSALLLAVLLSGALALSALAADGDITELLREALQTDAASVTLYEPTESFSSCGEILYSDETGVMQLAVSGEELAPLQSVTVSTESVYTPPDEAESDETDTWDSETDAWDGEAPYVPSGYVLVTLRADGREDYKACLSEQYTVSAAERAARREAEPEQETQTSEPQTPETTAAPVATAEPFVQLHTTEKKTLADRMGELSSGALALLIAVMVLGVAVLAELALLVVYKRRAENVAKNYLRSKAALDANRRELSAARSKSLRLERELMQEREKIEAVRVELEKLQNRHTKKTASLPKDSPEPTNGYDLDYLDWMM